MCACECVPGHSWVMGAVFGIDTVMTPVLSTHVTELLYGTALRSSLYQEGLMWNTPSPLFTLFHSRQAHSSQIHSIHSFNHYYKLVCLRLVIIRDQLIYQSAQAFPRPHPHPRPSPHHPSSRSLFSASKQSLLKERDIRSISRRFIITFIMTVVTRWRTKKTQTQGNKAPQRLVGQE